MICGEKIDLDTEMIIPTLSALTFAAVIAISAGESHAASPNLFGGNPGFKMALAENVERVDDLAAFYRARNFEPFWTTNDEQGRNRLNALILALSTADYHGLPIDRFNPEALRTRIAAVRTQRDRGRLEVEISRTYLDLARALSSGLTVPREIDPVTMPRDVDIIPADELMRRIEVGDPVVVLRELAPQSPEYVRLMRHRQLLQHAVDDGGWGAKVQATRLEPGASGPEVVALRERLREQGFLARSVSATYDTQMIAAVSRAQAAMGLRVDGVAGPRTIAALNVSAADRLGQVLVAMERERWLPRGRGVGREIWVNLPDFHTTVLDDGIETFRTVSVIGQAINGKHTPEFSDTMDHMVINPTWYVPRTIAVRDYLPRLRANPYAASYMRITDSRGREVNRSRGFSQFTARNFPFSMRQPPGPRNALGFVKFMFPNEHAIYLHDSPAKNLYEEDVRDFSSGCIRLKRPFEFGYHLLAAQEEDPEAFFQRILRSTNETRINLVSPIPVHLVYRTAFTDAQGGLNFRDDVYGRDAKVLRALSAEGVVVAPTGTPGRYMSALGRRE
ncbi:L,D-transpeptidase family protein [Jannaschia rubra]|uniref:L,D-transpeptidase family protein n=1 Tax=Jannaschia rubra TaxID=282197 RepID=UPI00248FA955|nr:L,D-transpeptidase family protein [Jannaschia rubra]